MNKLIQLSPWHADLNSFSYRPRSDTAGNSIFRFLRKLQTDFHCGCSSSHSHVASACKGSFSRVSLSTSVAWVLDDSHKTGGGGMEAHHNSDNISTMVINTANFFIYLLSICNSSETCLYKTSAYLLTSLFVFSSFAPHLFWVSTLCWLNSNKGFLSIL